MLHLPRFDPSFPFETPTTTGFNTITFIGNVEQQQQQQPSDDQQERAGKADVRLKDQQTGTIAKAQEERRHTVATWENLQITVPNKRKDHQQQKSSTAATLNIKAGCSNKKGPETPAKEAAAAEPAAAPTTTALRRTEATTRAATASSTATNADG